MMFKIKIIIALVLSLGVGAAVLYVNHLRSENAILTANNAVQEGAIISLKEENAAREADSKLKSQQLRERMAQIASLTKTTAQLNRELSNVTRHDPKVVECLATRPGPDFVNQLRQYTQGSGNKEAGETVPGPELL